MKRRPLGLRDQHGPANGHYQTPKAYAEANNLTPQAVYYYIRQEKLTAYECLCGTTVIRTLDADRIILKKDTDDADE